MNIENVLDRAFVYVPRESREFIIIMEIDHQTQTFRGYNHQTWKFRTFEFSDIDFDRDVFYTLETLRIFDDE